MDLTQISTNELLNDLEETKADILLCRRAFLMGLRSYGDDRSVVDRFRVNQEILVEIQAELRRRNGQNGS